MKKITVTVLENATIFDAGEQVHRYDLPASGILAGWAVSAVVDQIKVMSDGQWPDVEIAVSGPDRAVEVLTRTLLNKGVATYNAEEVAEEEAAAEPVLRRPTKGRRQATIARPSLFHVAMAAVIVTVLGFSWWGIDSAPKSAASSESRSDAPATSSSVPGSTIIYEYERVRVSLPPGFTLGPREDGMLVATGNDPNLRIVVAIDPVFGVDASKIRTEIAAMVAHDPALAEQPDRKLRPGEITMEYVETPGDGSSVHWVAWVAKEHQFSVGCHTKSAVSLSHRATCRMAVETLDFT